MLIIKEFRGRYLTIKITALPLLRDGDSILLFNDRISLLGDR